MQRVHRSDHNYKHVRSRIANGFAFGEPLTLLLFVDISPMNTFAAD